MKRLLIALALLALLPTTANPAPLEESEMTLILVLRIFQVSLLIAAVIYLWRFSRRQEPWEHRDKNK